MPDTLSAGSPTFREVEFQYDDMGRVQTVVGPGNEWGVYLWDLNSQLVGGWDPVHGTAVGNDTVDRWDFAYDIEGRLTKELLLTTDTAANHTFAKRSVQYDGVGRRTKQSCLSENRTGHLNLDTYQTYSQK